VYVIGIPSTFTSRLQRGMLFATTLLIQVLRIQERVAKDSSIYNCILPSPARTKMTLRRIASEIKHLQNDPSETRSAHPISDKNLYHWTAKITGPPDSPYATGEFEFRIYLPETYPHIGPRITFITPIFHPNVSGRGEVKLAELEQSQVVSCCYCTNAVDFCSSYAFGSEFG
jgi:hypothetical protein